MSDTPPTRRRRSDATGDGALVTATPSTWTRRPTGRSGAEGRLGWDSPRPSIEAAPGPIRSLQTSGSVLPELEDTPEHRRRPLWRHPAFLISIGTTLLAIIAFVVLLVLGVFASDASVTDLELEATDGAVRATWAGPDVPYQVIVVDGPAGDELDVSQLVTGSEIWLPRAAAIIDDASCIVVRPAEGNEEAEISLARSTLEAQGAAAECVSDAAAG